MTDTAAARAVPFTGRMSYCLAKSLKMALDHRGDRYPLPYLECVSTEAFGFVYVRGEDAGFAVVGFPYHLAGQRLLRTLGYAFELHAFEAPEPALAALDKALAGGPVVVGMLDAGFLTYDPDHHRKAGADHAVVALRLADRAIVVHDPDGYVSVPLPLGDFLRAWKAERLYTGLSYAFWTIGERSGRPSKRDVSRQALTLGLDNLRQEHEPPPSSALHGPRAIATLAVDLRAGRGKRAMGLYARFSFRVSAQRCLDGAAFIREAPFVNGTLERAAAIRQAQAAAYGEAQVGAAVHGPVDVAISLERIARLETELIAALDEGLAQVG